MLTERANAKINLFLDITGRRENGYHDLCTLMQSVSLCDLVSVEFRPGLHTSIRLEASGNDGMPTDCRNLAYRAAERFLIAAKRSGEVQIRLEKHIPMAAGLAGGSTDAAAVLRAMNRSCGNPLTLAELTDVARELGADVPFCLVGGCALCEGIGDRITPTAGLPENLSMVVACMGEGVSTPWGYGQLDERYAFFKEPHADPSRATRLSDALGNGDLTGAATWFYNIFEEVTESVRPFVTELKARMTGGGAFAAMMSGSGPSVFGLFDSPDAAQKTAAELTGMGAAAFVCHPMRRTWSEK